MGGPLDGAVVCDLTRYGPGPYCAMLLGDMGADVVVVDEARAGAMAAPGGALGGTGSWMRRNSRRIGLDLKHPDGQAVIRRLLARADVMLEGFRPGVAARLGLDPKALRRQHPRLVICSISGFGQDGPYRDRPAHDLNYVTMGGLLDGNRGSDGAPVVPATVLADLAAGGMQAAIGVLAALLARERTGEGQLVDVSLHEGMVALMAPMLTRLLGDTTREWTLLTGEAPWYNVYQTSDGRHISVAAVEPWFYATVCRLLGHPEWAGTQFDTSTWAGTRTEMAEVFRSRPLQAWRGLLEEEETCVAAVPTMAEVLDDGHLRARGTFVPVIRDDGTETVHVRPVPRLSETPLEIRRPPPRFGANTDEVLSDLGFDAAERDRLCAGGGVVRCR